MRKECLFRLVGVLGVFSLVAACGGGGGGGGSPIQPGPGSGDTAMEIYLTDGPIDDLDSVVVFIDRIEVHHTAGPFFTVSTRDRSFDLLQLKDRTIKIARVELEPGKYTQVRLYVTGGEVTVDGETHPLEIPSGTVKLLGPFQVPEGALAVMVLDFDAEKSIHVVETGQGKKYILRPVVLVKDYYFYTEEDCPDPSVSPADGATNVAVGTTISADFPADATLPADPSGLLEVRDGSGNVVTGTIEVSGQVATFTPDADLAAGQTYTVTVVRSKLPDLGFCPPVETTFTTAP